MTDLMDNWALWERVLAGEQVDSPSMAYLLESPSEYLLRRLLRAFPHRDELLLRFGTYIFEPPAALSTDKEVALAAQCLEERAQLASLLGLDRPFERVVHFVEEPPESYNTSIDADIRELVYDKVRSTLGAVHGGLQLRQVGLGVSGNDIWTSYYLVAPLTNGVVDLSAWAQLANVRHWPWLSSDGLVVGPLKPRSFQDNPGWKPVLHWPTEAEVQAHLDDEATIKQPDLPADKVARLIESNSPFASSMASYHHNLPLVFLAQFAASDDARLRTVAARNHKTDPALLAQLAQDDAAGVRLGVATNSTTPHDVINAMMDEQDTNILSLLVGHRHASVDALRAAATNHDWRVRLAVGRNPTTPIDVLVALTGDQHPNVRHAAADDPTN